MFEIVDTSYIFKTARDYCKQATRLALLLVRLAINFYDVDRQIRERNNELVAETMAVLYVYVEIRRRVKQFICGKLNEIRTTMPFKLEGVWVMPTSNAHNSRAPQSVPLDRTDLGICVLRGSSVCVVGWGRIEDEEL